MMIIMKIAMILKKILSQTFKYSTKNQASLTKNIKYKVNQANFRKVNIYRRIS